MQNQPVSGEETDDDFLAPTAAEQYIDFISGGSKTSDDLVDEEGYGGSKGTDGYGDEDYGLESLNLLLKHYHDKFADLPAEKIKDKLKEDVSKMDKDGDSQITKEELKAWFVEQAEIGSSLEAKKLEGMTSFDQNDDNRLSWDEVFDDLKKLGNVENPTFKRGIELEKVRFKHADKDEDGLLNESEYGFYATPEYFSHMNNYTILSYINDFDHDNDLKISKEEYLKHFDKINDAEGYEIEVKRFNEMDKNKDGFLSSDEVSHVALEFTLTTFIDKHAETLFMTVDADKDGKLSNVEIITNYPLFTSYSSGNTTDSHFKHDEL